MPDTFHSIGFSVNSNVKVESKTASTTSVGEHISIAQPPGSNRHALISISENLKPLFGHSCQQAFHTRKAIYAHACSFAPHECHPTYHRVNERLTQELSLLDAQIRISARYASFDDGLGQSREPALRLPFKRVLAPQSLIGIATKHTNNQIRALRDGNLAHGLSIVSNNRL